MNELDGVFAEIAALETQRASDLKTFLGTKARNGGPWSGAGITAGGHRGVRVPERAIARACTPTSAPHRT